MESGLDDGKTLLKTKLLINEGAGGQSAVAILACLSVVIFWCDRVGDHHCRLCINFTLA